MVKGVGRIPKAAHNYQMPTKKNKATEAVTGIAIRALKSLKVKGASIRKRVQPLKNKEGKRAADRTKKFVARDLLSKKT